jgi:phosphate transport system protein
MALTLFTHTGGAMTKHMQRDLERLQAVVLKMAGSVEGAIFAAIRVLRGRDPAGAEAGGAGDTEIDLLENQVFEECLKILALHQPVAVDLRRITAVMLISTDLERMGDLACGIAERGAELATPPHFPIPERLAHMTATATDMVRKSLDCFVQGNADAARDVVRLDDEVDADNRQIIEWITGEMKKGGEFVVPGIAMFSVIRHLERIADHAAAIAEDVIYLVEGEVVRHRPDAIGPKG